MGSTPVLCILTFKSDVLTIQVGDEARVMHCIFNSYFRFGCNLKYLIDAIGSITTKSDGILLQFSDSIKPMLCSNGAKHDLLLPVRVEAYRNNPYVSLK